MLPTFPVLMIACAVLFAHGPAQAAGTSGKDPEARAGAKLVTAMRATRVPAKDAAGAQQAFIDRYCSSCHNGDDVAGSLDLFSFWVMALLAVGFGAAVKKPASSAAIGIVVLWGIYVMGKAAMAAIF